MKFGIAPILGVALLASCLAPALAAQIAYDSAGDSTYNGGFTQGGNGGYGWGGGWSITNAMFAAVGDSTTNGPGSPTGAGDINSPRVHSGRAWGLNWNNQAGRPFAGALAVGQTFSVDYDNGFTGPVTPQDDMTLNTNGAPMISFGFDTSNNTYALGYSGVSVDTHVPKTYGGLHLEFTWTQLDYTVKITPDAVGLTGTVTTFPSPKGLTR